MYLCNEELRVCTYACDYYATTPGGVRQASVVVWMDLRTIVSDIDPKHLQVLLICRARVCILLLWKDFWHTLQCRSNCALWKAADPGVGCAMARDGYFVAAVA